jgi:alpha-methylacyl-CoA racemase
VTGPLAGLRVLEFAGLGPAPLAAMILSDLGAEVVRIDRLDDLRRGASTSGPLRATLRGRRSIALDLRRPEARDVVLGLVETSSALIDPFRPGVMERLGLGPEPCSTRNPRLVYSRMTGYGQDGPLADKAGHDINYLALAGVLAHLGPPDAPPPPPLSLVGDFGGGTMFLVVGIVSALLHAERTGSGQVIDVAMTDGAAILMGPTYDSLSSGGWRLERGQNLLDGAAPFYRCYETADGGFLAVGAIEPKFYAQLLEGLGLADEPGQYDRSSWPALRERFATIFATRTRDEWMDRFEGLDACVAPVLTMAEAPHHPHNVSRRAFWEVDGVAGQPAPAPRFSRWPDRPTPVGTVPGGDTDDILAELGMTADERDRLAATGVVGSPGAQPAGTTR